MIFGELNSAVTGLGSGALSPDELRCLSCRRSDVQ